MRFYFTNTANTRLFNVALPGARMKLIGGDSGRYEHETFVDEVLLAPSERAIVDVALRDAPGTFHLEHRTPEPHLRARHRHRRRRAVGRVARSHAFETLRTSAELTAERARIEPTGPRPPDKTLAFESLMPLLYGDPADRRRRLDVPDAPRRRQRRAGHLPDAG